MKYETNHKMHLLISGGGAMISIVVLAYCIYKVATEAPNAANLLVVAILAALALVMSLVFLEETRKEYRRPKCHYIC